MQQDPSDEPASVLLERIKAQRARGKQAASRNAHVKCVCQGCYHRGAVIAPSGRPTVMM